MQSKLTRAGEYIKRQLETSQQDCNNCRVEGVGFSGACSNFAHIAKFRSCLEVAEGWDFGCPILNFPFVARFRMGLPLVFSLDIQRHRSAISSSTPVD